MALGRTAPSARIARTISPYCMAGKKKSRDDSITFNQFLHSLFEWITMIKVQLNPIQPALPGARASAPCLFGWGRPGRIGVRILKYTQKSLAELIANTHAPHTRVGLHTGRKDASPFSLLALCSSSSLPRRAASLFLMMAKLDQGCSCSSHSSGNWHLHMAE